MTYNSFDPPLLFMRFDRSELYDCLPSSLKLFVGIMIKGRLKNVFQTTF